MAGSLSEKSEPNCVVNPQNSEPYISVLGSPSPTGYVSFKSIERHSKTPAQESLMSVLPGGHSQNTKSADQKAGSKESIEWDPTDESTTGPQL